MQAIQLHEDGLLKILWDRKAHIIGFDWQDLTAAMTGEQFKPEVPLFACYVAEIRNSQLTDRCPAIST